LLFPAYKKFTAIYYSDKLTASWRGIIWENYLHSEASTFAKYPSLNVFADNPEVVGKLPKAKVYLDITFMVNFIMDFVILLAAGRLSGSIIHYPRIIVSASLGAVYACASMLWHSSLAYSMPVKLGFSLLLVFIAFYPSECHRFIKQLIYFYCISLFAAGAAIALPNLVSTSGGGASSSFLWLAGAAFLVIVLGLTGGKYLAARIVPGILTFDVEMCFDDLRCTGCGFLDTGNSLRDPLTNRPVLVAEYSLLKDCLPQDFQQAIEAGTNENEVFERLSGSGWASRLRLIPYQSIGQTNGILLGIRADEVLVYAARKSISHYGLVVALYLGRLSADDSYRMLIPAEVVEK